MIHVGELNGSAFSLLLGNAGIKSHRYGLTVSQSSQSSQSISASEQNGDRSKTIHSESPQCLLQISLGVDQWLFKAFVDVKK